MQHVMYVNTYTLHVFEDANGSKQVQASTRRYMEVHGGTRNSTRRYKTVCTGMYWYALIQPEGLRFNPARVCCPAAGFAAAILPGR